MSSDTKTSQKVCKVCQSDVAQLPRVKDAHGRYYCKPCYEGASKRNATPPSAKAPAAPAKPSAPVVRAVKVTPRETPAASLDDFMDGFDPTSAEVIEAPIPGAVAKVGRCPNCNIPLTPDAVICIACGTNTKSGKKLKGAAVGVAAAGLATQAAKALGNYAQGVLFGAIGAAIGAALWCGVAVATGYQIGYIAWALGGLAGFGMQLGYGDSNSKAGFTAIGLSVLGIAGAKIGIVYFLLKGEIPVGELMSFEVIKLTMGPKDFLFIALAMITAYRLGTHGLSFDE